jgi:ABC-type bacteriocin/lantibiotic exporter with double-glycine peptidase domain
MPAMIIAILPNCRREIMQRIVIVGTTGSGKTTLAKVQ